MKEDDKTFHMNQIDLISKMKQPCFQTKHTFNQPVRWVTNTIWGNWNNVKCVKGITKSSEYTMKEGYLAMLCKNLKSENTKVWSVRQFLGLCNLK